MSQFEIEPRRWTIAGAWTALALVALLASLALFARPDPAPAAGQQRGSCSLAERPAAELSVKELRRSVVCLINRERKRHDVERLARDGDLQQAAQRHTRVIVETECFAHRCPGEPDLETRIRRSGYLEGARTWGYAESTGCAASAAAMVANWASTPFHRANVLGRKFEHLGIGAAKRAPAARCKPGFATFTAVFGWRQG